VVIIVDFGISSVNSVVAPIIAELHSKGESKRLQRVLTLSVSGVSLYALAALVFIVFAGRFILGLFGNDFVAGYPVLIILAIGKFFHTLTGSVGFLMTMTGHELDAFRIRVISIILALSASLLAIPVWGMIGAAAASSLGIMVWNVMLVIRVRALFNIDPTILSVIGLRPS
jgi:O-antigen/teichoic acid export membrane protein